MARATDREDPADVFLEFYDAIGDEPWQNQDVVGWLRNDSWVANRSALVCRHVVAEGRAPRDLIAPIASAGARGVFAVLKGLDDALAHADPRSSTAHATGGLIDVAMRQFTEGRLNSDPSDGLLLFRVAEAPRPQGLPARASTFGVVRVPREVMKLYNVDFARMPRAFDLPFELPGQGHDGRLAVGCVPLIDSYDDLSIELRDNHATPRYRIRPRAATLRDRVHAVLQALDESGATIGMLPEAALSDEMLDIWKDAIRSKSPDSDSRLRWILVGTGPVGGSEPPFNRAVVLLRDGGHEILAYDKHFDFTLSPSQLREWGLEDRLGAGPVCEDIRRGDRLVVRESTLGRFAILICEDVTRLTEIGAALGHFGVSHVLVPIFSPPLTTSTWEAWAARDVVRHMGACMVVANSLAVGHSDKANDVLGTCSAVVPPPHGDEWPRIDPIIGETSRADAVVRLWIPAGDIARFTE